MDPKTHRKCNCCQGTGLVPLDPSTTATANLSAINEHLTTLKNLNTQILYAATLQSKHPTQPHKQGATASFIKQLLKRHNPKLDVDWIHYNLLNMVDEGLLEYEETTNRYNIV